MKHLISAAAMTALAAGSIPSEIVYIPEGDSTITPRVNGTPKEITVRVPASRGAAIAASLQAALEKRHAANVRPWFDFEHKAGTASALPKAFRYEAGKGIMCSLEWTAAGMAAIQGRDFSYFSPTFMLGDDGMPDGLPERGPLGALVNEPAFRNIQRIAASDASHLVEGSGGRLQREATALVMAGQASDLNEALYMVCANDPAAYQEYLDTLDDPTARDWYRSTLESQPTVHAAEAATIRIHAEMSLEDLETVCASDPTAYNRYLATLSR